LRNIGKDKFPPLFGVDLIQENVNVLDQGPHIHHQGHFLR
jgi:hypothetical protein